MSADGRAGRNADFMTHSYPICPPWRGPAPSLGPRCVPAGRRSPKQRRPGQERPGRRPDTEDRRSWRRSPDPEQLGVEGQCRRATVSLANRKVRSSPSGPKGWAPDSPRPAPRTGGGKPAGEGEPASRGPGCAAWAGLAGGTGRLIGLFMRSFGPERSPCLVHPPFGECCTGGQRACSAQMCRSQRGEASVARRAKQAYGAVSSAP